MNNNKLVVIAHNIRSTHNIGALLRTSEGLGIDKVILSGYTPHPIINDDIRLPHIANKIHKQIHKTALGAEETQTWEYIENIDDVLNELRTADYLVAGLEQTADSIELTSFKPSGNLAILLGSEVEGIDNELIEKLDICLEIPMFGQKESFNVVEAASMAMYHCKFML